MTKYLMTMIGSDPCAPFVIDIPVIEDKWIQDAMWQHEQEAWKILGEDIPAANPPTLTCLSLSRDAAGFIVIYAIADDEDYNAGTTGFIGRLA
jgi:hypothetical protein